MKARLSATRSPRIAPSSARRSGPGGRRASSRLPVTVSPASEMPAAIPISEMTVP